MAKKISKILKSSGFTLVEILIIIVIIGILAYIGFVVFSGLIKRVGNPQRYAVLSEISGALVRYNIDHNNQYPDSLSKLTAGYLDSLPKDPVTNLSYPYEIGSDFSWAILYSTLDKTALSYTPACSLPPGCQPVNFNRTDDYVWGCRTFGNINCGEVNTFPLPPSGSGPTPTPTPAPTSAPTPTPTPSASCSAIDYSSTGGSGTNIYSGGQPACDPAGTLANGVVGYWKFNESSWPYGPYTITDYSGYGDSGAVGLCSAGGYYGSYSIPVSGKFGNAASFVGVGSAGIYAGSIAEIPKGAWVPGSNDFTISLWVNVSSSNTSGSTIFETSWDSGMNGFYLIANTPNAMTFSMMDSGAGWLIKNYNIGAYTDSWENIVITRTGLSNIIFYVNGIAVTPASSNSNNFTGNLNVRLPLYLGRSYMALGANWYQVPFYTGQIDDLRIYNRALSQTEVNLLYNGGNGCVP